MSEPVYKAHSSTDSYLGAEPPRLLEIEPDVDVLDLDEVEDDPYPDGWRERWETRPDGSETLVRIALTSEDLLSPKEGDCVPEDTVHRDTTEDVAGIVRLREDESTVAVWRNLKLDVKIPKVTDGPAPDLCVIDGVRDPQRRRKSFRLGKVSGRLRLVMEVVSERSKKKDVKTLPEIYARLGAEEYVVLEAEGDYIDDVFDVTAWRRDPATGQLLPVKPDSEGRLHLTTVGLLFGTGAENRGLVIWDAATGERQRPPLEEVRFQRARAEREAQARKEAEQEKREETEARKKAERLNREMLAELEKLRAQVPKPPS